MAWGTKDFLSLTFEHDSDGCEHAFLPGQYAVQGVSLSVIDRCLQKFLFSASNAIYICSMPTTVPAFLTSPFIRPVSLFLALPPQHTAPQHGRKLSMTNWQNICRSLLQMLRLCPDGTVKRNAADFAAMQAVVEYSLSLDVTNKQIRLFLKIV